MNVLDELVRLGVAMNAEQAAAWKGITLPRNPLTSDDEVAVAEVGQPINQTDEE